MITDSIGDLIIRIKNAGAVGHESLFVPYSKFKMEVAKKLKNLGYVQGVEKKGKNAKKFIKISLMYEKDGTHKIRDVKRISKPGRRMYKKLNQIIPVKYGFGNILLSTSKGVLTGKEAKEAKVGGEALFEIH